MDDAALLRKWVTETKIQCVPKSGSAQKSANCQQMKRLVPLLPQRNFSKNSCKSLEMDLSPSTMGCQHGHYTDRCFVAKFTSQLDEQE